MDHDVKRQSQPTQTTAMKTPTAMGPDHSTQIEPVAVAMSPREPLQQYSCPPDDLPVANPLLESMEPFQPDKSKFDLLPDELLIMTVDALATADSALKYTKGYQAYRANLYNLCLVSRRMDGLTRPALYKDLRLYSNARSIRLCSTLLTYTHLTGHVKSVLFFPSYEDMPRDSRIVDLRPLRQLEDPDFTYWTRGRNAAKVQMPETTREELVYNLLFKVLSRTPSLEALYLRLPERRCPDSHCLFRQRADAECIQQLNLQHQLFDGFCQGSSIPHLPQLKTVGVLGGCRDGGDFYKFVPLFQNFLRSPNLVEVCWAQLNPMEVPSEFWESPLLKDHIADWPAAPDNNNVMSTSVKRISLRGIRIAMEDIEGLIKAFPSLECLAIDGKCELGEVGLPWVGQHICQVLGQLGNFHTLEFDCSAPDCFKVDISAASGITELVRLSALSKLHTLVVPADFFIDFTSYERPCIQRTTGLLPDSLLPDSLRHLTLLLNTSCESRLADEPPEHGMQLDIARMAEEFLREEAPTLLIEFPHLDKIDLCYHMEQYRQGKVHTLAAARPPQAMQQVERKRPERI